MRYTDEDAIRDAFWAEHPQWREEDRILNHAGTGLMYPTDVRVAFSEFIDTLSEDGAISRDMAHYVTLSR